MLELLIASGARISELARLCLNDFDRSHQTLRLLGKGSKERIVPLYNKAFDSLDIYIRQARLALLEKAHCSQSDTTRLFISDRGRPMDAAALRRRFDLLVRKAGLPAGITPHTMRHTYATELLEGGADCTQVSRSSWAIARFPRRRFTHMCRPNAFARRYIKPIRERDTCLIRVGADRFIGIDPCVFFSACYYFAGCAWHSSIHFTRTATCLPRCSSLGSSGPSGR